MNLTHTPDQIPAAIARIDAWLRDIATSRAATLARRDRLRAAIDQCDHVESFLVGAQDWALTRRAELMNQLEDG